MGRRAHLKGTRWRICASGLPGAPAATAGTICEVVAYDRGTKTTDDYVLVRITYGPLLGRTYWAEPSELEALPPCPPTP